VPAAPWGAEALLVILRWLHSLATVAFLGSALTLLLMPAARDSSIVTRFKEIADVTLVVFLATGAVLAVDRLSQGAGTVYGFTLLAKVVLSLGAYQLALRWRRSGLLAISRDGRGLILCGAGVILLAAVLKGIFESGIRG
jgi:uncharacterized membrane protein